MTAAEQPIIVDRCDIGPCAGCANRSKEGVYALECFGCRRYYGSADGADLHSDPYLMPLLGVGG